MRRKTFVSKNLFMWLIGMMACMVLSACKGNKQADVEMTDTTQTVVEGIPSEKASPVAAAPATSDRHVSYGGISFDMDIAAFRAQLEKKGYALGEVNQAHHMVKYYNQFEAVWVYYDASTKKVWLTLMLDLHYENQELGNEGWKRMDQIVIPMYAAKYGKREPFNSNIDCIEIPGGMYLFGYNQELGGVVMSVDKVNSNNLDNLYDPAYGLDDYFSFGGD